MTCDREDQGSTLFIISMSMTSNEREVLGSIPSHKNSFLRYMKLVCSCQSLILYYGLGLICSFNFHNISSLVKIIIV